MPHDQRRINGPEVTVPYKVYVNLNQPKSKKISIKDQLKVRKDGREHKKIRPMSIKLGVVSQAKGSAYIELDHTKVICSVYDPREIPNKTSYSNQGELYCDFKYSSFSCSKRRIHQQDAEEKEFGVLMKRALEPAVCRDEFPNFQVDIYALVLENQGSALSTAITAASLALANASVPMYGIVAASTVGIYDNFLLLDPTDHEESLCLSTDQVDQQINHGIVMQALMPQHDQISEFFVLGNLDLESVKKAMTFLEEGNRIMFPILQQQLTKLIMKSLKKKSKEKPDSQ